MFERKSMDNADALTDAARRVPGLNVERFRIDLQSAAIAEAFAADLERTRAAAPETHTEQRRRVPFPAFEFRPAGAAAGDPPASAVYDSGEVGELRAAAAAAGATANGGLPGVEDTVAALRPAGDGRGRGGVRSARPARGGRALAPGLRMAAAGRARAHRRAVAARPSGAHSRSTSRAGSRADALAPCAGGRFTSRGPRRARACAAAPRR